ncbi:RNA polymerase sigma factor [Sphingomonas sp. R647]|uniref:RNA polymerase sigma factor n=1 Tax=Sphingomonas sp. R647 TaxID=2875233 RepID=UPI001CD358F3|nr:RNA polymerase sigma factor [Sphingomonas sp. R647]MCA1197261.1 RNA polymerase sigma factor [Sphingomonas sp. R647]
MVSRGEIVTTRAELAEWVGREILPLERDLRSWLRRRVATPTDVEDIVQECYCRLARLHDVSHITQPRAYLYAVARNLLQNQLKAARVVRLEAIAELDMEWRSDDPSPEDVVMARSELGRVQAALATLSERARSIFVMRRVEGMSQREIAQAMGVSEAVVENDASRSLRAILQLLTDPDVESDRGVRGGKRRNA